MLCIFFAEPVLFLNGRIIPNNTILDINEVGEGNHALLCLTNLTACCRRLDTIDRSGAIGNWLYSNGENIPNFNITQQGMGLGRFYGNRGMSTVRLNHLSTGVRPLEVEEGLLQCSIPDDNGDFQDLFVGVYAESGKLIIILCIWQVGVALIGVGGIGMLEWVWNFKAMLEWVWSFVRC